MLSPTTLALVFSLPLFFLALSRTPYESERIPLTPGQIDSTLLRADSFLMSCQIDSARVLYSAVRNEQKNSLRALIGLGRVALAERDWGEALDMAERVWRVDTANIPSHYLAAVAYRELGINKLLHSDWKSSRRQFEWIVERDSSFDDALYQFALLERYEGDLEHALELARAQTAKKPELEGPQLAVYKLYKYFMAVEDSADFLEWLRKQPGSLPRYFVAETFRRHGNLDAAEPLFMELLAQPREVCPQALHLSVARLHIKQGDRLNAEHDYWKAVQELRTELGAGILFEDLKYIVSDRELEYFGSLVSVDAKRDFFRSFWNFRNPSLALKTNLRLQEHIRRYVVAEEEYEYYGFRTRFNNPDNLNELAFPKSFALNEEFNDKGLIYLRQGDPDDIVRHSYSPYDDDEAKERWMKLGGNNIKEFRDFADVRLDRYNHAQKEPYESWLYSPTTESPKMIFHFQKHNTAGNNWRLTACPTYDPMIDELKLWDSRYQRIYDAEETDRAILETQVKTESKALVDYALTTEKHTWEKKTETFRFAHSIDVFRAPDGRSLLDISYAIPIAPLARSVADTARSLPVEIGVSLIDAKSHKAASQLDTLLVGLSRTRTGVIVDLIRYTVPPDSYAVSMHIRPLCADMIGTWRQTLRVVDFSRPGLMLSTIQLLRPSTEKGSVLIDGVKVVQSPFRTHVRMEPLYIYFQVYHLVLDDFGNTSYATECILLPRDKQDLNEGVVVYRKQKTGSEEMVAEFCQIDVHSVDPGQYKLLVRVTDRKRVQTLIAERELDILKP